MFKKALLLLPAVLSASAWAYTVKLDSSSTAYLRPAQTAQIDVMVSPKPTSLYSLIVKVNGEYKAANVDKIELPSVDYGLGEQVVTAELQDETGRVVASDSRSIYFLQRNLIIEKEKEKAKQKAAYEALPWYKKLYVSMRQDEVRLDTSGVKDSDLPPIVSGEPIIPKSLSPQANLTPIDFQQF